MIKILLAFFISCMLMFYIGRKTMEAETHTTLVECKLDSMNKANHKNHYYMLFTKCVHKKVIYPQWQYLDDDDDQ